MLHKLRSHLTYANVGTTVALVFATTGFAVAAIPRPDGTITGCYKQKKGSLRVIDVSKKCPKGEKRIVWSQKGPKGDTGLAGTTGAQGPKGDAGPKGDTGTTGAAGTARAYALVQQGAPPTFKNGRVKNFIAVTNPATGVYCLTPAPGIDVSQVEPGVTVDYDNSLGTNLVAMVDSSHNGCPAGAYEINTFIWPMGGNAAFSNGVDFNVVVP